MEVESSNETMREMETKNGDSLQSQSETKSPSSSNSSGDSGDESSSADSEDESQQSAQLKVLEANLSSDPSNYDFHVQYIKLLRKMGEIEKLRQAREAMSAIFPLTPQMWQEWAKDEASISTASEAFSVVEKLYERGIFDYMSVPLWCDYLNYVQENDPSVSGCSADGISKLRNLFERALTAAGLHVSEGSQIWEAYREFEQAILLTIDETDIKAREAQIQQIRSLFQRQLSVPLENLRPTLLSFKAWEVKHGNVLDALSGDLDGISSHVASAYQKAMEMYIVRVHHEEQISRKDVSDTEKFQNFMNYLKFEKSEGDPARVQVLNERAITDFPVSSDLWLGYTQYLDKTLKVGNVIQDVYSRATKNCPWVGELWVQHLLSLERNRASEEVISAVFEKSLTCSFTTFEEYLELFLTRIDGLRRRILSSGEVEGVLDYSLVRETFKYASDYLSSHLKNSDGLLNLHAYWARLELSLGKDLVTARGVWESLLKISGSMLEAWQGYIAMEIELGHTSEARSIYKRCYSKRFAGTGSEDICRAWLRFERQFGTLEDFDHAVQKVTPRLEELQLYRTQQESKTFAGAMDQRENTIKKISREKRKGGLDTTAEQSPAKRQKQIAQNQNKGYEKDKNDLQIPAEVNAAVEATDKVEQRDITHGKQTKDTEGGKLQEYTDQCTAFISNLHLKTNYDDLRRFFGDVGVVSIRILHDKFTGKSRGLAYVDFSDDEHLAAAVAKNKQMLLGKRLSIARSDPKRNKKSSQSAPKERAHTGDQSGSNGGSASKRSVEISKSREPQNPHAVVRMRDGTAQLKGKTAFLPRNVRPNKPKAADEGDDKPKSNEEFRKLFISD
uniref:RRM domain-containing protein n=3 Tax=Rhizophora mucronata TaxID=61149 RepID=A0A2P2M5R6_RHIMU